MIPRFTTEFKEKQCWKFVKNEAPDKFVEEAVEFSKQIEELNYEDKFKKIKSENKIRGRLGDYNK